MAVTTTFETETLAEAYKLRSNGTTDELTPRVVPTIDISPYLQDPKSTAAEEIIDEVRKACKTSGFFSIVGHGVPRQVQQGIFDAAKEFFALPFDEKKKLDARTTLGNRGYDVLASQSYIDGVLPDLKEGFYVGEDLPADDPRVKEKRFFMGQNVWPPTSLISSESFKNPVEAYFKEIFNLSLVILEIIARTLPYGDDVFANFVANNPVTPLRLLHYPPKRETEIPQFGSSAHTDFGAITLLLQDHNPGLQVQDSESGEWVRVAPNPDAYVVNVGDMLSKWTSDLYKSSWHRVVNENKGDRYSIVFFFDGNLDCPLTLLDGSKGEDEVLTVEKHMIHRMTTSYNTGKKD